MAEAPNTVHFWNEDETMLMLTHLKQLNIKKKKKTWTGETQHISAPSVREADNYVIFFIVCKPRKRIELR